MQENAPLEVATMLTRKDTTYNEIKPALAKILLERVTIEYLEYSGLTPSQKEYLVKCFITSISINENQEVRQLII